MQYFYAMRVTGKPDWSKVPAIAFTNRHTEGKRKATDYFKGKFQVAYDDKKPVFAG